MSDLYLSVTTIANYWRSAGVGVGAVIPFVPFIDKFDINFSLHVLMMDPTPMVAKVKLTGYIAQLRLNFSADLCHSLYRIGLVLAADPPDFIVKVSDGSIDADVYPYLDLIVDDDVDISAGTGIKMKTAGEKVHIIHFILCLR